jgi:hypothetical protein
VLFWFYEFDNSASSLFELTAQNIYFFGASDQLSAASRTTRMGITMIKINTLSMAVFAIFVNAGVLLSLSA